jgi:hypothetical protein
VPGHEHNALRHKVIRHRDRLLGVAGVVSDGQLKLFAHHAASFVDIRDRHFRTAFELVAECGIGPGNWTRRRNFDGLGIGHANAERRYRDSGSD